MALPLAGVRVLEMCQVYAGPFAGMLLADQGAEVIKLESLEGDSSRVGVPAFPDTNGLSLPFVTFNRNKRSILVNIHTPKGKELADSLLQWADVLLIATRVATRQRWGFTYEDIAAVNPRIIYASITAYGEEGPDADFPGYDVAVQARGGDLLIRQQPDGSPSPTAPVYHFDMATGMLAAYAVALALRQREDTGQGQKISLSLFQSALACQSVNMTRLAGGDPPPTPPGRLPGNFLCSDGRYIFTTGGGARWEGLCRTLGLGHLLEDPRFDTIEKRAEQVEELTEILSRQFSTKPAAEWEATLNAAGQIGSVIKEISEVYDDPQAIANQMFTQFEQTGIGAAEVVNVPFNMSGNANETWLRKHPPTKGEHTLQVLQELGRSSEEFEALKAEGIIG